MRARLLHFLPVILLFLSLSGRAFAEPVGRIEVEGNNRIEKAAILERVHSKAGGELLQKRIRGDARRIFKMGYFRDVQVQFDQGVLTFVVKEKVTLRKVVFEGNDEVDTDDLEEEVQTKSFSYMDRSKIRRDVERIRRLYDGKGYYLAEIEPVLKDLPNNDANLTFKIDEGKRVLIRQISFIGNRRFPDSELKDALRTKEKGFFSFLSGSGSFDEDLLAADRQLLREYYGRKGYIKAKVGAPRVQLAPDKRSLSLTFTVEEGQAYTVGRVALDGDFIKDREELEKLVVLKEGRVADTTLIQRDIAKLTTTYADEGYAYANIIPRDVYEEDKKIVHITYYLQPGPKVWVEKIQFVGNDSTRDKVLRREMRIQEGELFRATKIAQSRQNIERLALFEEVRLSTPRGSADDRVNILVDIKEKPTGAFQIGAGFNTLESFQVIGQIQKRNLFGYGVDIALQARVGKRTQAFNLQYRDEYFLDSRLGLTLNAFNIGRRYSNFDLDSRGGTLGFDYPVYTKGLERIRAGLTYNLVDQNLSNIRPTVENLFEGGLTSSITLSLSRDTRNRVFEPSQGSLLRVTEEIAGGPFGGDNPFSKTELDAKWFFPVLERRRIPLLGGSVFALHFNAGFVAPIEDDKRVPLFERYFPGGILSLRGFEIRSLGPTIDVASSNDPTGFTTAEFTVGGNKQVIFNAEYIFPIIRPANIKGVFFFDMGNAFDNGESLFTITGQRQSVGFGVRWFSPIGPLRFEWGFPLDKKEDESTVVFDFTIGSLF